MFCERCGNQVQEGDGFCAKCGAELHTEGGQSAGGNWEKEKKVEEMTRYCLEHCKIICKTAINRNSADKTQERVLRCYFRAIEKEIQSDEEELLYFAGIHNFKSMLRNLGPYGYVLTNRRLIMAGAYGSNADGFNYYQMMRYLFSKNFSCRMKSLYLKDLKNVTEDMVSGKDVIRFETSNGSFHVMFFSNDITHKLSRELREALASLKAEA